MQLSCTQLKKKRNLSTPYLIAVDDNVYFSLLQELQKTNKKTAKYSKDKTLHVRI